MAAPVSKTFAIALLAVALSVLDNNLTVHAIAQTSVSGDTDAESIEVGAESIEVGAGKGRDTERSRSWHALIVVGLPGDEERRTRFNSIARTWKDWLTGGLGVDRQHVTVLGGIEEGDDAPATPEKIRHTVESLTQDLDRDDALWVFLLGHGSQDERHGWFHLPGPDMNEADWAGMFAELKAGEQVFWLTHSASGRFVKAFSLPGRVVIAATGDGEVNETRFPEALATVTEKHDGSSITLLQLFRDAVDQVQRWYDKNELVPTEHARLDDNGDGSGSETSQLADATPSPGEAEAAGATIDGFLSRKIRLEWDVNRSESEKEASTTTSQ